MRQRQKNPLSGYKNPTLMQVGIFLVLAALLVVVAANVGMALLPLANLMLIAGVVIVILALVVPGKR